MKYDVRFTNQFKKDIRLAQRQGKNVDKVFDVIVRLADGEKLEPKYRDHELIGDYKGYRECHIEPDWLLVYQIVDNVLVLLLYRLGSHSESFK